MKHSYLTLLLLFFLSSCAQKDVDKDSWTIAFKSDKDGNTIAGSKKVLIDVIRNGGDVKVAWGFKGKTHSIEHLSEPIWLAILDEKEVIAHLNPQVLSAIDWVNLKPNYADSTLAIQEWRVVISTKGDFDAIWYDRKENRVTERRPQDHPLTWMVRTTDFTNSSTPLFKE